MNNQKILIDSWGYDMTINDYALVIEETDKTVKCVMIGTSISDDNGMGNGRSIPNPSIVKSEPFRLRKKDWGDRVSYRGSYDFCNGSKRFGMFAEWDGKPNYYNTWD